MQIKRKVLAETTPEENAEGRAIALERKAIKDLADLFKEMAYNAITEQQAKAIDYFNKLKEKYNILGEFTHDFEKGLIFKDVLEDAEGNEVTDNVTPSPATAPEPEKPKDDDKTEGNPTATTPEEAPNE